MDEIETIEEISDELVEERKTLKEILVEMKDVSEAIIDLAYSSVLMNSVELAEIVIELEERMDILRYEIEIKAMMAARNRNDAEDLAGILHVASAAENISDAAKEIVDVVIRGEGDHPLLVSMITEADETLTKVEINKGSILSDTSLGDLRLATRIGAYIVAVRRKGKWLHKPKKTFTLKQGDILLATGSKDAADTLKKLARGEIKSIS